MSEAATPRRRPLLLRLWPLWLVFVFVVVCVLARRESVPSWDWADSPAFQARPASERTIEANPANIQSVLDQAAPGDAILLADGEYIPVRSGRTRVVQTSSGPVLASQPLTIAHSGLPGKPVTIRPKGSHAVLKCGLSLESVQWIVLSGLKFSPPDGLALSVNKSANIIIRDCDVDAGKCVRAVDVESSRRVLFERSAVYGTQQGSGICFMGRIRDCVIRKNYVHDVAVSGIMVDRGGEINQWVSEVLIDANTITRCGATGGSAINVSNTVNSVFRHNLIYKNAASGIGFSRAWWMDPYRGNTLKSIALWLVTPRSPDSRGNTIVGNTIYFEPGKGRSALNILDKCPGFYVHNNVFYGGLGGVIVVSPESESGLNIDYNVILTYSGQTPMGGHYPDDPPSVPSFTFDQWRSKGFDRHSKFGVDPLFVSIENDDYRLRPGSPAIDAGAGLGGRCPSDMAGVKRPQGKGFDCGAYEFGAPQMESTVPIGGRHE
jgi:hypothetical protein